MPSVDVYIKKPVQVRAIQYDGTNIQEIWEYFGAGNIIGPTEDTRPYVHTLEGRMYFDPDHWIIEGVKGEVYPCRDDIFRITYERKEGG